MGSDFNSCRFDFRLDVKTGLLPSRRRRAAGSSSSAARPGVDRASAADGLRLPAADVTAGGGGGGGVAHCSTLYSCKVCGCLLRSRADRKAHTQTHRHASRTHDRHVAHLSPPPGLSSENQPPPVLGAINGLPSRPSGVELVDTHHQHLSLIHI